MSAFLRLLLAAIFTVGIAFSTDTLQAQSFNDDFSGVLSFGNKSSNEVAEVEITATVTGQADGTAVVAVTAEVPDGYYIYSTNPAFGASTQIQLTELGELIEAEGEWKADRAPKVVYDEVLEQDVEKFFGTVTWSKSFRGFILANSVVKGKLNGQYCGSGENGVPGECRPIRNRAFTATVIMADAALNVPASESDVIKPDAAAATAVEEVTSVSLSPKIGYGKSAKAGLIDFGVSLSPEKPAIGDVVTLSVVANIKEPYHTYAMDFAGDGNPTSIELETKTGLEAVDEKPVALTVPKEETGADNSILRVHYGEVEWRQKFKVTEAAVKLSGTIAFQLCDETKCLAPSTAPFELTLMASSAPTKSSVTAETGDAGAGASESGAQSEEDPSDTYSQFGATKDKSLYGLILAAIGGGLLSLLTPCVYPMLPVTVAFFLKQEEKKPGSSLLLAIVYSLSMIVAFTIFGVGLSWLYGASFANTVANNPWLNIFIAAVFMAFALMFFGVFEVRVPSWLLTWTSKRESSGGFIGVIFMALTFTLVSFTCTFAVVGQIAILAQDGSILTAIIGMVAFSATFATPFFLLAMFPSVLSKMPKSGGWMNRVKVTIGLVELAMVLKFLSVADIGFSSNGLPVYLDRASFLVGWMAIAVVTGMYLLGVFRFGSDMEMKGVPVLQVLLAIGFFGIAGYIGAGMFAPSPPTGWVWSQIVALAPPDFQSSGSESHSSGKSRGPVIRQDDVLGVVIEHHGLTFGMDFDRAVAEAVRTSKPLFIDFTGVNCPNCRGMEQDVLSQPKMVGVLEKMVRVQLYTDSIPGVSDAKERDRILEFNRNLQEQWLKDSALPGYAVASSDGKTALAAFAGYDNTRGVDFLKFLNAGIQRFEKSAATVASAKKAKD